MAKPTAKNVLVPAAILTAICIVISGLLALTNDITHKKIAEEAKKESMAAMSVIYSDAGVSFQDLTATDKEGNEFSYSKAELKGETLGYIFTTNTNGYGGQVSVMTGINVDGSIKSIQILSVADETPGLGQNAKSEDFTKQFSGKESEISKEKNKEINAITGATITTNAVIDDVNLARELFNIVTGGEK